LGVSVQKCVECKHVPRSTLTHVPSVDPLQDGRAEYVEYVEKNHRSLADLLISEFSSAKIPLAHFLHLVPSLQPRYYTISSSSSAYPATIHITVSVTEKVSLRDRLSWPF
jgi:sulfite reductase alpha subunit-like flavoprotein